MLGDSLNYIPEGSYTELPFQLQNNSWKECALVRQCLAMVE